MLRATDKITALYCRLSVEDMNKNGGKEDESNSIQNQKMILLQYAKENRFPNPTFFVDDGYSGTNYDRPGIPSHACGNRSGTGGCLYHQRLLCDNGTKSERP